MDCRKESRHHRGFAVALLFIFALLLSPSGLAGADAAPLATAPAGVRLPGAPAPIPTALAIEQARLSASDGAASDQLGWSVALYGDTALVGAPCDDAGANDDQGSVYVFVRSAGGWTQQARLTAADGAGEDLFGSSVALSGDAALVGAPSDDAGSDVNQGSVYVFVRSGDIWTQQARLAAPGGGAWRGFGWSVALDGDTAIVGDPYYSGVDYIRTGAAFVFVRAGALWSLQQQLAADAAAESDWFGDAVALDGDTALIGAPGQNAGTSANHGAAYAFVRSGTSWSQQARVTGAGGAAEERFGDAVAIAGDSALVGSPFDHIGANQDQGSASVFVRSGASWTLQQTLTASDRAPADDHFGGALALVGDTAVIGVEEDEVDLEGGSSHWAQGSASVFVRSRGSWSRQARLTASDGATQDRFGSSVALDGDVALIGAVDADVGARIDQGSAYVFVGNAPETSARLSPAANVYGWNKTAVTLTLSAHDVFSGVAATEYRLAGAADWAPYAAPFPVNAPGDTTYEYRSTDTLGNVEATRRLTIRIDTTRPVTVAIADATAVSGRRGTLRFRVNDAISPKAWGTVKVFKGTTVRQTLMFPLRPTNTEIRYPFTCTLARGTYIWKVYAADMANNRQSRVGQKTLTVK